MPDHNDTARFLQAVFPDHRSHAIFGHSKATGGMWHARRFEALDATRDCYWSVASFPDNGHAIRRNERASEVRALVVDDVGTKVSLGATKLALGEPTAIVESSKDNFQFVYRLSKGMPVAEWGRFFATVEALVGAPLEGRDAVHLFRLPMGLNTKPGRDLFHVKLVSVNPAVSLDVDNIGDNFGALTGPGGARSSDDGGSVRDIMGLMKLIPNQGAQDYTWWEPHAQRCWGIAVDKEAAHEAWTWWSDQNPANRPEETERVWASLRDVWTSGKELLAEAETADPDGYAAWQVRETDVFNDGVEPPPPEATARKAGPGDVDFATGANDEILKNMENAARGLEGLGVVCRKDVFHHRILVGAERLSDDLIVDLRVLLIQAYEKDFGLVHVYDAVVAMASQHKFNPVVDMLAAAEALWDGVPRLDRLGPDYFHSEDTALARACFRKVMLAAVRRARSPGCKFDQILVCESPEGWNKSTAWACLAGEGNFSDANILGKDARAVQEELGDIWIHENSDLSGLSKAEVEHVKAFASRTNDRARPAYGRVLLDQPRQSIEVGTTNASSYLLSPTGNRRFWTFTISAPVEIGMLERDRMQLWGEAAAAESLGETLVLDQRLWKAAEAAADARRVVDPWEDELANLGGHMAVTVREGKEWITRVGVHEVLRQRGQAMNAGSGRRIAEIMRRLGWDDARYKIDGVAVRGFERAPIKGSDTLKAPSGTDVAPKKVF